MFGNIISSLQSTLLEQSSLNMLASLKRRTVAASLSTSSRPKNTDHGGSWRVLPGDTRKGHNKENEAILRQRRCPTRELTIITFIVALFLVTFVWTLESPLGSHYYRDVQTPSRDVQTPSQQKTDSPPFTIFYHVYVSPDGGEEAVNKTMRVVKEQIGQVGHSYATSLDSMVNLHYVTIGMRDAVKFTEMQTLCKQNRIRCSHLGHHDLGFEGVTLQAIKDFCEPYGADDSHRVIYLHSKGAYHSNAYNHQWRRGLTTAVTSEMCLKPENDTCNLCGMIYMPMWASFMPGNMWAAKCSYIKKLLPVESYKEKSNDLMRGVKNMIGNKTISFRLLIMGKKKKMREVFGLDRFADEHWVGGHPSVIPCDVSKSSNLGKIPRNVSIADFKFSMAPHDPVEAARLRFSPNKTKGVLKNQTLRIKEYFFLGGKLLLWLNLYNETPPASSWVWDWFPDGTEWRQAMVEHQGTSAGYAQPYTREGRLLHILQHGRFQN